MNLELFSRLIASGFFLGLLLLPFAWFARTPATRRALLWVALVLINLSGLWILLVAYLVTRLEGSHPPTLGQAFVQGLWIPALILVLANLAAFGVSRLRK